jgi:ubiquinone/menaquinone biosynthesis C-methylase UbiE
MATDQKESYIVDRYRLWDRWQPANYSYKHVKGARIAQILEDTGGIAPLTLELGVGPGGVAVEVSRHGTKVVGIDLSPEALMLAKKYCANEDVHLMRASGFALPFVDRSLELVYASQVLHLFDPAGRLALLKEAHRVLKSGGRFVFDMKNVTSHPARYLTSEKGKRERNFPPMSQLLSLLEDSGYSKVETRPGVLPLYKTARVPNLWPFRALSHSTFFIAVRP